MTEAQRIRAIHLVGAQLAWCRTQAQRYRALAASNDGEKALNEAGARVCDQDAAVWESVLNLVVDGLEDGESTKHS